MKEALEHYLDLELAEERAKGERALQQERAQHAVQVWAMRNREDVRRRRAQRFERQLIITVLVLFAANVWQAVAR